MAGGPLWAFSQAPGTNGRAYPTILYLAQNLRPYVGTGVSASLATDATLTMVYQMPYDGLPSGTMKVVLLSVAQAIAGTAQVAVEWSAVTASGNMDTVTLANEGTSAIAWGAGDTGNFKQTVVTLDATAAPSTGEYLTMVLTYDATNWTLAAESVWNCGVIWE